MPSGGKAPSEHRSGKSTKKTASPIKGSKSTKTRHRSRATAEKSTRKSPEKHSSKADGSSTRTKAATSKAAPPARTPAIALATAKSAGKAIAARRLRQDAGAATAATAAPAKAAKRGDSVYTYESYTPPPSPRAKEKDSAPASTWIRSQSPPTRRSAKTATLTTNGSGGGSSKKATMVPRKKAMLKPRARSPSRDDSRSRSPRVRGRGRSFDRALYSERVPRDRGSREPSEDRYMKGKGKGKSRFWEAYEVGFGKGIWKGKGKGNGRSESGRRGGGAGDGQVSGNRLHVSNLPGHITEGSLDDIFGQCGKVLGLQMLRNNSAIIRMESAEDAQAALTMFEKGQVEGLGSARLNLAKPNPRWDT